MGSDVGKVRRAAPARGAEQTSAPKTQAALARGAAPAAKQEAGADDGGGVVRRWERVLPWPAARHVGQPPAAAGVID